MKKENDLIEALSRISHEMKTPINLITATAKIADMIINDNTITNDQLEYHKKYMENIINNCDRVSIMINNIMSLSDISFMPHEICETVNIKKFINAFCCSLEPYSKLYKFNLKYNINVEKQDINIYTSAVQRILLNLVTNAVKYNSKKEKNVVINVLNDEKSTIFEVKDNGDGIDEKNIPNVTKMFYREKPHMASGMGLGLSIVEKSVKKMNGTLLIKSKATSGTSVFFSIPYTKNKTLKESDSNYILTESTIKAEFSTLHENI